MAILLPLLLLGRSLKEGASENLQRSLSLDNKEQIKVGNCSYFARKGNFGLQRLQKNFKSGRKNSSFHFATETQEAHPTSKLFTLETRTGSGASKNTGAFESWNVSMKHYYRCSFQFYKAEHKNPYDVISEIQILSKKTFILMFLLLSVQENAMLSQTRSLLPTIHARAISTAFFRKTSRRTRFLIIRTVFKGRVFQGNVFKDNTSTALLKIIT